MALWNKHWPFIVATMWIVVVLTKTELTAAVLSINVTLWFIYYEYRAMRIEERERDNGSVQDDIP